MAEANRTQLAVVGAGPGGYGAAFMAADIGLEVALVDPEPNPGGTCLYRGCIPSKALLHVAKVVDEAEAAERWGVRYGRPELDLDRLRGWKDGVVERLTTGLGQLVKSRKIRHLRGRGRLVDAHTLEVALASGGTELVRFEHAILATGSEPARLPLVPEGSERFLDSTSALELARVPPRLLVVGGGYIGLELGWVYARLGSRVSVVEATGGLLPGMDRDLVRPLAKRLERRLEAIMVETSVARFEERASGVLATFEGKAAPAGPVEYDAVLVAVGRKPVTRGLGLERTRVELDERGFVKVDRSLRTSEPSLLAIGDLVGQPMLAHKATREGRVAAEVVAGRKVAFEPLAIPAVVFTDPEIAWTGLTESAARAEGREVRELRFPWAASGRAMSLDRTEGSTKLVVDAKTGILLGAGVVGAGAGELSGEATLAIEMQARAEDLELTIHAHPTLSETLMEAAAVLDGTPTHVHRPRRA